MTINIQRDDRRRLITVTISGSCDAEELWGTISIAATLIGRVPYAMLYDLRNIADESATFALQQIVHTAESSPVVGIAVRATPRLFGTAMRLTGGRSQFEVLMNPRQLDAWLERNAHGFSGERCHWTKS